MAIDRSRPTKGSVHGQRKLAPSRPAAAAGPGAMTTAHAIATTALARAPVKGSLRLEPDLARDLAPQVVLRPDESAGLVGRPGAVGEEADDRELMRQFRILEDLVELLVHPGDGLGRGARRR